MSDPETARNDTLPATGAETAPAAPLLPDRAPILPDRAPLLPDAEMVRQFERHGFTVRSFATGAEARDYLVETIRGRTVGFGGSVTVRQLGRAVTLGWSASVTGRHLCLTEALGKRNAALSHHEVATEAVRRLANMAKIYITSANAVSRTGEIVNIDGSGNRLSGSMFGPEKVYFLIGRNKVTPDLHAALHRAKNVASPMNARRLGLKLPCAAGDRCYDCDSPQRICRCTLITERAPNHIASEIIFIDEDLGY